MASNSSAIIFKSTMLKNPYKINQNICQKMKTNILKYIHLKNFEVYFIDFNRNTFCQQVNIIFENIKEGMEKSDSTLIQRYLGENIYLYEEKSQKNLQTSYLKNHFMIKPYNWKIVNATTLYGFGLASPLWEDYAQITLQYNIEVPNKNKSLDSKDEIISNKREKELTKYIVLQRNLAENISFHSWKIIVLDYI